MPVGPVPVRGGAFDEFTGVALDEAIRQILAVEHVLGEQVVLVVHQVLAADHVVQHAGRILRFLLSFPFCNLVGGLVAAKQVDEFVEQRHVRHGPGVAVGAPQRRVGARRT